MRGIIEAVMNGNGDRTREGKRFSFPVYALATLGLAVRAQTSNPFQSGCLHNIQGYSKRVCNSDDPPSASQDGICIPSPFDYSEIRILNQSWDSPMLSSWVLQILLSELLQVPTTIETHESNKFHNYYDAKARSDYSSATYDMDVLRFAVEVAGNDCRRSKAEDDLSGNYRPCANVMPLFRSSSIDSVYRDLRNDGIADSGERVCVWNRSMQ